MFRNKSIFSRPVAPDAQPLGGCVAARASRRAPREREKGDVELIRIHRNCQGSPLFVITAGPIKRFRKSVRGFQKVAGLLRLDASGRVCAFLFFQHLPAK